MPINYNIVNSIILRNLTLMFKMYETIKEVKCSGIFDSPASFKFECKMAFHTVSIYGTKIKRPKNLHLVDRLV